MKVVHVKYRQHQLHYEVPNGWGELNSRQTLLYFQLLHFAAVKGIADRSKIKGQFMGTLFHRKDRRLLSRLPDWQAHEVSKALDFLFDEPIHYPKIDGFACKGKVYKLPKAMLENSTFLEFVLADVYMRLTARKEPLALERLVATLCRTQDKKSADGRKSIDTKDLEATAAIFEKHLPAAYKLYVLSFYQGAMKQIQAAYPALFPDASEPGESPGTTQASPRPTGWIDTMYDVAEKGTFGTLSQVQGSDAHQVLMYLDKEVRESNKIRREIDKQKRK